MLLFIKAISSVNTNCCIVLFTAVAEFLLSRAKVADCSLFGSSSRLNQCILSKERVSVAKVLSIVQQAGMGGGLLLTKVACFCWDYDYSTVLVYTLKLEVTLCKVCL
jgi:hypothetical protein